MVRGPGSDVSNRRNAKREPVVITADLRQFGKTPFRVIVRDLSLTGCRCETTAKVRIGDQLWISFPGLSAINGIIRWATPQEFGVEWLKPLHVAIFDHISKSHPDLF